MSKQKEVAAVNISKKSFITAVGVIFVLMVISYILTLIIPGGAYQYTESGELISDSFTSVEGGLPFWKWLLSPFLVLGASGSGTIIAVIAFLVVIGGVFNCLEKSGLLLHMLQTLTRKFGAKRYQFLAVLIFFFMAMGSLIGSFEEIVPLVPIVVSLMVNFGFDTLTGLGASLLAVGCGFAAGVFNPFTVGVAQTICGLPMFSGAWLRIVAFFAIYILLTFCVMLHARKVAKPVQNKYINVEATDEKLYNRGLIAFAAIMGFGLLLVLSSALPLPFAETLQDLSMVIMTLAFLAGGIVSTLLVKKGGRFLGRTFASGVVSMLPAILMVLMASSIKYILQEANILDTILHACIEYAGHLPRIAIILFIYLIVLVMNFFIASGSAKAVMLMPLIVPLAAAFGIPAQLCVLAYAFGDGFSNVIYPTNPVLLISLGVTNVSYGQWFKWSIKFQLLNLLLTSGILLLGLECGYC